MDHGRDVYSVILIKLHKNLNCVHSHVYRKIRAQDMCRFPRPISPISIPDNRIRHTFNSREVMQGMAPVSACQAYASMHFMQARVIRKPFYSDKIEKEEFSLRKGIKYV